MRLDPEAVRVIKLEVAAAFGPGTSVRLFGSRVDDEARGGDVDLYVETGLSREEAFAGEQRLYARLQRLLGDRRLDIVTHSRDTPLRPIDREAIRTGVLL
jgi:predicted nucleotidyltransferase